MSVNTVYARLKGVPRITALRRSRKVSFEDAPDTQTLNNDSPIGFKGLGFGLNLANNKIDPAYELYLDASCLRYVHDITTSHYIVSNIGTHEVMLLYKIVKQ